jgi:hypothetical protein
MNVKQQLQRRGRPEQRRENDGSSTKNIILNTDHKQEFFKQGISVSGHLPILSFAGTYSVGLLPKIWTPFLEFTVSKETIMFIVKIRNIENKFIIECNMTSK